MMPIKQRLAEWLEERWYGDSPGALWLLWPVACVFRVLVLLRRWCLMRLQVRLSVPVWVIGNLTVGGSGKSQMVQHLTTQLQAEGHSPGVIMRGYRGEANAKPCEVTAESTPAEVGDEALMHYRRLQVPVVVCADRVKAGQYLLERHPEVNILLSDDGMQHYRLARDKEFLMINAERRLGNQQVLPVGPCREDPSDRLRQVDVVVETGEGCEAADNWLRAVPEMLFSARDPRQTLELSELKHKRVHAVAAIAHPDRFQRTLEGLDAMVLPHFYPDHAELTKKAVDLDIEYDEMIVLTEKDWVKLPEEEYDHRHWVLRLRFDSSWNCVDEVR